MPMNLKLHPYKEEQFGKKSGINYEVIKTDYNLNFKPDKREIISVEITLKIKGETRTLIQKLYPKMNKEPWLKSLLPSS